MANSLLTQLEPVLKRLLEKVRLFQSQFWFSGADIFQIFGAVRRAEREKPGSASMAALAVFQPMFKQPDPKQDRPEDGLAEDEASLDLSELFDEDED